MQINIYLRRLISLLPILLFMFVVCRAVFFSVELSSSWLLPKSLEGKLSLVQGVVVSLPRESALAKSFYFKINRLGGAKVTGTIKLSWYRSRKALHVGDLWQLLVKLKRPRGFADPGAFDYASYLRRNGVGAVGYIKKSTLNRRLSSSKLWSYPVGKLRAQIAKALLQFDGRDKLIGIVIALTVGSRNWITPDVWRVFRATGTSHLIAISGLHIGLAFSLIYLILNFIIKRLGWFVRRVPSKIIAAIGGFGFASIYALLAGFGFSTQRALLMIFVFVLAVVLRRNLDIWRGIILAFCIILLLQPAVLFSASLLLSFTAVAVLLISFSGRSSSVRQPLWWRIWWQWGHAQFVVIIGLLVLSLYLFGQISLVSWLANLIAIPALSFLLVPLLLIAIMLLSINKVLAKYCLLAALHILHFVWQYLAWLARHNWAVYHHCISSLWLLALGLVGSSLILLPLGMPGRWLGVVVLWPIVFSKSIPPPYGEINFTLLDVGQGLAAVVRTEHHLLIYDTGPKFSATFDAGEAVVVPYIRYLNLQHVDMLVVSHGDNDHIGGANSVLTALPVAKIITSVPERFLPRTAQHCWAGEHWHWDGVQFTFLSPQRGSNFSGNNASCVLRVAAGKKSVLLTGDMQAVAEQAMVKRYKKLLPSTIVVAPHHGSNTSSTVTFVNAVDPKYVLFPVGYLNRFHFPSPVVMARYHRIGAKLVATDKAGAITFLLRKHTNKLRFFRKSK